ncbi:hypothetical protein GOBAR_AA10067 [Gossypium barbadense]|uniref:CRAL-TRIO domain-containing protein n=1 Tax=Gossypium barbadense TaxID=3634 RepID=A0A2P5Y4T6_GOSBA|nr:hypothetical protein GOBAR_AA10067 [Gossypium barbadense]
MEKSHELELTQMRKSVEKLGFSTEKYGDPTLMRFLIARSMDTDKASKMFVQWLKWRSSLVPNGCVVESEVPDQLEARKVFLQGLSKTGYPVMIVQACKHYPPKDHLQFKKFVVYLLDKTIASCLKGSALHPSSLDENEGKSPTLHLNAGIFPRALGKVLHCAYAEIVIVTNDDEKKIFIEDIGEEALPVEYGGKAILRAIQDVQIFDNTVAAPEGAKPSNDQCCYQ